ncbi:hypothetical protein KAR91_20190 [Candidatus Pacearchaeota archaeon]|nr:hypothetical protein [Candidatus Pacearchaeota archaeon]
MAIIEFFSQVFLSGNSQSTKGRIDKAIHTTIPPDTMLQILCDVENSRYKYLAGALEEDAFNDIIEQLHEALQFCQADPFTIIVTAPQESISLYILGEKDGPLRYAETEIDSKEIFIIDPNDPLHAQEESMNAQLDIQDDPDFPDKLLSGEIHLDDPTPEIFGFEDPEFQKVPQFNDIERAAIDTAFSPETADKLLIGEDEETKKTEPTA